MVRTHGEDASDRKLLGDIEKHGWHLVGISEEGDQPAYVFSVGLYHTLSHPEVCIFGLKSTETMGRILNLVGDLVRGGDQFKDWHQSDQVLDGYQCAFRRVDPKFYREYFGYARWYYESDDFPMLQCVWPDGGSNFPWHSEYAPELVATQPVLAQKAVWPFLEAKNLGVFTTGPVLEQGYPILRVTHEEEGDWQFLCDTTLESEDCRLVCLEHIIENHPSVAELADLPLGCSANREDPGKPWVREA